MKSQEKLPRAMADYGKRFEQGLEQMSPFEIKNDLISYAKECDQKAVCQFLNAGRGNPNWINTDTARIPSAMKSSAQPKTG